MNHRGFPTNFSEKSRRFVECRNENIETKSAPVLVLLVPRRNTYEDEVELSANISQATGQSNTEQFGNLENYDKVIVTDWIDCPINENSVLFIDKAPEWKNAEYNEATAITVTGATVKVPVYDYTVRRVAKSLNSISIAVSKVKVS